MFFIRDYKLDIISTENSEKFGIENLKIEFSLNRKKKNKEQTGNIKVYGLSKDSQRHIKKDNVVKLRAGYKDNIKQIFLGKIKSVKKNKSMVEIKFNEGSGIKKNRIAKRYPDKTKIKDMLKDCLKGAEDIEKNFSFKKISNKILTKGMSINDSIENVINFVEKNTDVDISVGNGVMNATQKDFEEVSINQNKVVILDYSSGLINVSKDEDDRVKFKCLLIPGININSFIKIYLKESLYSLFTGVVGSGYVYCKTEDLSFKGNSDTGEWVIEGIAEKSKIEESKTEIIGS